MNQRIKEAINFLKQQREVLSAGEFASEVGIGKSQLSEVISGKRKVSEKYILKILSRFPQFSEEWLRYGQGEMLSNIASAGNHAVALAGDDIKKNTISVNTDKTISMLVAELSAQRQLTEKVIDQNTDLIAIIAAMNNK